MGKGENRPWKTQASVVNVTEVLAIEVDDSPGGLNNLLKIIEDANINVEYMYAFAFRAADKAIMFFRFNDPDQAVKVFESKKVNVIGED